MRKARCSRRRQSAPRRAAARPLRSTGAPLVFIHIKSNSKPQKRNPTTQSAAQGESKKIAAAKPKRYISKPPLGPNALSPIAACSRSRVAKTHVYRDRTLSQNSPSRGSSPKPPKSIRSSKTAVRITISPGTHVSPQTNKIIDTRKSNGAVPDPSQSRNMPPLRPQLWPLSAAPKRIQRTPARPIRAPSTNGV